MHAQEVPPPPPGYGGIAPAGEQSPAEALAPPPPGYGGQAAPQGYGSGVPPPPPSSYTLPPAVPQPSPFVEVDADRRASGEMVELYIAGSLYGALTGVWLATLMGVPDEAGSSAFPLLFGAGGALAVLGADVSGDGFRTGVPAAIAMGALIGLGQGSLLLAAFSDDIEDDTSALALVWGATTVGGAAGALAGSWLRPSIGDSRLVASTSLWGAYFGAMAAIAADTRDEESATWVLGGLDAGLAVGLLLAPAIDLDAGRVMLLHAGVGAGALAGLMVLAFVSRDPSDIDDGTLATTIGVGSLLGLVGMYLLVRPSDPPHEPEATTAFVPFVAPTEAGGVMGVGGRL